MNRVKTILQITMVDDHIPIAQPYYETNPTYQPSIFVDVHNIKRNIHCFMIGATLDICMKSIFVIYSPYLVIHIILACCGYFGAYYKKKLLLIIYILYQFICFCIGAIVIINVFNNKLIHFNIDIKYLYVIASIYMSESLVMGICTHNLILKISQVSNIHQPFIS